MRDRSKNRAGYDRVLMAVAATFLTVSATSAFAQAGPARSSAAELAIDAAIPRPEPANVPPPTASDFKLDSTASVPDAAKAVEPTTTDKTTAETPTEKAAEPKPADVVTAPAAAPPAAATAAPAPEPVKAASVVPAADQPVADKLRELMGAKASRYFDRKGERAAVEKFYAAREFAPLWTQSGTATASAKGVIARLKDAGRRRPECGRLSGAGFRRGDNARCARGSRTEADRQHAGLRAPGAEQPDALVAGRVRHPLSRTSDRSRRSAGECHDRQGRVGSTRGLQSAAQALQGFEGQARRTARPGRRTGDADRRGPAARLQGRHQEAAGGHAGRSARAATARQARHHRKPRRHQIRRQGRRGRAQVPGRRRHQADRRARRQDRQGDQQPEARPPDRHRDRQHGALALAAAPARRAGARQCLRHAQRSRLHAQGDAERRDRSGPPGW